MRLSICPCCCSCCSPSLCYRAAVRLCQSKEEWETHQQRGLSSLSALFDKDKNEEVMLSAVEGAISSLAHRRAQDFTSGLSPSLSPPLSFFFVSSVYVVVVAVSVSAAVTPLCYLSMLSLLLWVSGPLLPPCVICLCCRCCCGCQCRCCSTMFVIALTHCCVCSPPLFLSHSNALVLKLTLL